MEKKKILIIGSSGMAGHVVYHYLSSTSKYEIYDISYRQRINEQSILLDVTNTENLENIINTIKPKFIVNCVGILIKGSKDFPDNAIYLNAYFPHLLARIAAHLGIKVIHISTDCVFSGKKGGYAETDFRDADDIYGRSKALGEIINNKDLTIRTSIIGPELKKDGEGLFHWFFSQKGSIMGYAQAYWDGVTTLELAKAIDYAIDRDAIGLVHLTNGVRISKFDLLILHKDIWNKKDVQIIPSDHKTIDKSLMKSTKFDYNVQTYSDMLVELYTWMNLHRELYSFYKF